MSGGDISLGGEGQPWDLDSQAAGRRRKQQCSGEAEVPVSLGPPHPRSHKARVHPCRSFLLKQVQVSVPASHLESPTLKHPDISGPEQPEKPQPPGGKASYRPAKAVVLMEPQGHPTPGTSHRVRLADGFILQTVPEPSM